MNEIEENTAEGEDCGKCGGDGKQRDSVGLAGDYCEACNGSGRKPASTQQAPADHPDPVSELKSCPWCNKPLTERRNRPNPYARCETEGCHAQKLPVLGLDDPVAIASWNRRQQATSPDAVIDETADSGEDVTCAECGHGRHYRQGDYLVCIVPDCECGEPPALDVFTIPNTPDSSDAKPAGDLIADAAREIVIQLMDEPLNETRFNARVHGVKIAIAQVVQRREEKVIDEFVERVHAEWESRGSDRSELSDCLRSVAEEMKRDAL